MFIAIGCTEQAYRVAVSPHIRVDMVSAQKCGDAVGCGDCVRQLEQIAELEQEMARLRVEVATQQAEMTRLTERVGALLAALESP